MNEFMKKFVSNFVLPLSLIITLSLAGLFLQVSGHDSRIVTVEKDVETMSNEMKNIKDIGNTLKQNQEQILYKLCLLINDNNLSEC
jgi:hypothetical protein